VDEYNAEAGVLDEESVRLAEELPKYRAAEKIITDLFTLIAAHRQRISALHRRRPCGVESVRDPELIARNLGGFDGTQRSLLTEVHLVDWDSGREIWPPPQPSLAVACAAIMPSYGRRFSADWAKDDELRAAGQRAEQQRMADYYARTTREQEERENREGRERFDESQRNKWGGT
jgi:hypothetical protein